MAAKIIELNFLDFNPQVTSTQLQNLVSVSSLQSTLGPNSCIEFFTYDNNLNILFSEYMFSDYTIQNDNKSSLTNEISNIIFNPETILTNLGYDEGQYNTYFNFLDKKIGSNIQTLFIKEISSDRTEMKLDSFNLTDVDIIEQTNKFIQEREQSNLFIEFQLNFGNNQLITANNLKLEYPNTNNPYILVKLLSPLPDNFSLNSTLWIVTYLSDPKVYQVTFEDVPIIFNETTPISGPNFNLNLKDQVNNSTLESSYNDLILTSLTSSINQINSLLEKKEININIDYTNFSEFIHFSSIKTRLENFEYKIKLIENYLSSISLLNNTTNSPITINNDISTYESKISNIITNFDRYEYYLYYSSESFAWPKLTLESPYLLYPSTDPITLTWLGSDDPSNPYYGGISLSASLYDESNQNNLFYTIPEYLREDPSNSQYLLFIDMVGQHYDNIWVYYKDVSQKYNADNRLKSGVSKDIVADAIRDFGIKLYQNNFSNEDLYTAFLGLTPDGGLFPFPNITGSSPTPPGYEYVDTLISASNDYLPLDDVNKSLYKRIYHNLPYLLKSKGTLPGLRALITSYGIPDTILRIKEYGGKDKVNTNDWDYWQNEFNYAYKQNGDNFISSSFVLNSSWGATSSRPETVMFRFKTNGLPTSSIPYSQSLLTLHHTVPLLPISSLHLRYSGSAYTSGSYSGSIIDPYYQYAYLDFYPDNTLSSPPSASIYLPFFNGDWWSVMFKKIGTGASTNFELYSGNKMYGSGENGTSIGFIASSSITADDDYFNQANIAFFGSSSVVNSGPNIGTYNKFSGSFQEIRYYSKPISESVFKDYIMNPSSIEGNSLNSGADQLAFRLPLGGELYTGSNSIHPKVTGSWLTTSSFASDSTASFNSTPTFVPNTEYFYYDQPVVGIKNAIADKIRVENNVIPEGDVLSPFMSLSQQANISQSYTANTNLLEVAFSPQDEVNDDINSSLGFFNIGEYIGDPRLRPSSAESYPDLNALRDSYFQKYTKNYNLVDFVRLIKFFDNSLFKMIKDFVPARTSFASGIVIKQHILERNKYPQPQVDTNSTIAYYPSGSGSSTINNLPFTFQDISVSGTLLPQWNDYNAGTVENFNGGTAGTFEIFNGVNSSPYGPNGTGPENIFNLTQSWYETVPTPSGSVSILHDAQDEFYNGEFEGSVIIATTQSLHQEFQNQYIDFLYTPVIYAPNLYSGNLFTTPIVLNDDIATYQFTQDQFLNNLTVPAQGEILLLDNFRIKPPPYTPSPFAYVKIHKIDNNNNNNGVALGQATRLRIKFTILNNYRLIGDIVETTEYLTYYLYKVQLLDFIYFNEANNYIKDYSVSASFTSSIFQFATGSENITTLFPYQPSPANTNIFTQFNTSSGTYTSPGTPNVRLSITASITTSGSSTSIWTLISNGVPLLDGNSPGSSLILQPAGSNVTRTLSGSFFALDGDNIQLVGYRDGSGFSQIIKSGSFLVTQSSNWSISTSPTAPVSCSIIIEPYITENNFFYNSDNNVLLNSVNNQRENSYALDVDYTAGILPPINFNALINGTAIPATVPDSNYTSKKSTLLKYDGSKSTSQLLNTWSPPGTIEGYSDTGTYGKLPTVESLKTHIAYCDNDTFGGLSGWPPEHENASAMFIKYLIKADGTVVIPNTSKDSLSIMQQTFLTGERVVISSAGGTPLNPYRTIIRGGAHLEPVLYTQYGNLPSINFNTTMSFEDIVLAPGGATANYAASYLTSASLGITPNTTTTIPLTIKLYGTAAIGTLNSYDVTTACVQDGVDLTFILTSGFQIANNGFSGLNYTITFALYKNSITSNNILGQTNFGPYNPSIQQLPLDATNSNGGTDLVLTQTISSANLNAGDKIFATVTIAHNVPFGVTFYHSLVGSTLQVSQYPIFTSPVTSSGYNTIWGYGNKTTHPYIITSSNTTLVQLYGNPNVKATDISGSGFNSIQVPWKINYGDEFKFEGREDWSYLVKKIYAPEESGSGRVFQTGSIEVHFNANLPVSASSNVFNLDHFLIRRYVDDAAQNVITGFRPQGSTSPYLIKPEFVVPELNKNIDEVILDLTQKGLIT
jgi:hypothetical protein